MQVVMDHDDILTAIADWEAFRKQWAMGYNDAYANSINRWKRAVKLSPQDYVMKFAYDDGFAAGEKVRICEGYIE